jgi:hypothetical protein
MIPRCYKGGIVVAANMKSNIVWYIVPLAERTSTEFAFSKCFVLITLCLIRASAGDHIEKLAALLRRC